MKTRSKKTYLSELLFVSILAAAGLSVMSCSTVSASLSFRSDHDAAAEKIVSRARLIPGQGSGVVAKSSPSAGSASAAKSVSPAKGGTYSAPDAIMGCGAMSESRLTSFFLENNSSADPVKVRRMAGYYIEESRVEGVNADVAFIQMCLETGFLRFGGAVTEDMNNFCGLGTVGGGKSGQRFPDERTGVRAHIQHLKAYGTSAPLAGRPVDPRYKYVTPKGKAVTVHGLSGTWAADRQYGMKLSALLDRLYS